MSQEEKKNFHSRLVFDIESNGLLLDVDTIWCIVGYDLDTKKFHSFGPNNIEEGIDFIFSYDELIGHNIIGYDLKVIEKIYKRTYNGILTDTLILGKLAYYDMDSSFGHSLDAYGQRLGEPKGKHSDWTKFSTEMLEYCEQDVTVNAKIYQHLMRKTRTWLPREALDIEQDVQKIMTTQYLNGWTLDVKSAQQLHIELMQEYEKSLAELQDVFKPMFLPEGKVTTPKKPFRRMGVYTVGPNQKIKLTEFNPGSGKHIVWWVDHLYGEQKWIRTEKGNPKTDSDTLLSMFEDKDWSAPLLHYLEVTKILGQLAEGPKAWLKLEQDGKIHHSVDILGTNTGRATHNNPNLAQVPSPRAYKGKEARQLFIPRTGWKAVGCDLSGVELRCLAHYMAPYDGGDYGKVILEGDIHTVNQQAAGLPTRDMAKTMIYGYLYGAGDAKIGEIVSGGAKEGKTIRNKFESKLPALKKLVNLVKEASKRGYLRGITGRRLHVRSPHSALNVLLQSLGAYISKVWMLEAHKEIKLQKVRCAQLGYIHDELQFECHPEDTEKLSKVLEKAANTAGDRLKLKCRIDAESQIGDNWYDVH